MINQILLFTGSLLTLIWGTAHLFPTSSVVKGFGAISADNKHIITMEWIIEGVALIYIGTLVGGITLLNIENIVSHFVYISSAIVLIILAIISLFTGFKVKFLPFRLCPIIFTASSMLIILGVIL
jgi:hypothetical protein